MAGSRLVAVRKALITALAPLAPLDEDRVEVSFQYKAGSEKRERVYTQRARFNHRGAALRTGRNFRDETGRFELIIAVEGVGKDQEWTSERATELGLPCEEFIADHKNNELGVEGLQTLRIDGDGELHEMFADSGHLAILLYPVLYTARLT